VQCLIGFANYLAKFMPHLSAVYEPLRWLLDKIIPWHWLPKHEAAVQEMKSLASSMPVLHYYNIMNPVIIQSDSSQSGLGCCLMQEGQPIAFASRALTPTSTSITTYMVESWSPLKLTTNHSLPYSVNLSSTYPIGFKACS
jgi:hypothetical protein